MAVAKVVNIATTLEELKQKGVWIFAAAAETYENPGNSGVSSRVYHEADYKLPAALVVGNEGEGLAPVIIKNSDFLVRIPMLGRIESLNVSCAAAILMYEAAKQRAEQMPDIPDTQDTE
jgi:23S rRNA (guanosine2251-2'-O)-methyltransferase